MTCTNSFIQSIDMEAIQKNEQSIYDGAIKMSKEVQSGGKQIKMILKQFHVDAVAHAGDGYFFEESGRWILDPTPTEMVKCHKYKIEYRNMETGDSFVWCFD